MSINTISEEELIIYVGDSQVTEKQPLKQAVIEFWTWLYSSFPNATIIHGGDFFECSSHHHELVHQMLELILKFKKFILVTGNHDVSYMKGNILKPFQLHTNIIVYEQKTIFEENGIKFIALPHINYKEKVYEEITNEEIGNDIDYSICHFEPIQESFDKKSGVELQFKVNTAHIFSHIHRHREFIDNFGNKVLIAGGVVPIKNGEEDWEKNVYIIKKGSYEKIKVPQYFTYETIEYGETPSKDTNILNVIEAPSKQAVYEMYKKYNIRQEGIKLKRTDVNKKQLTIEDVKNTFEGDNLLAPFIKFSEEESDIKTEVYDECILRLSKTYEEVK